MVGKKEDTRNKVVLFNEQRLYFSFIIKSIKSTTGLHFLTPFFGSDFEADFTESVPNGELLGWRN